ncbi:hypothetical protein MRX96_053366 [Rhipicephalus microplus]
MKSVVELESRLNGGSIRPCMFYYMKNILHEFGGSVSHLKRQHQRLLLVLQESGLRLHRIRMRFRPCSSGTTFAVFDIPFSAYVTVYLIGCSLSVLAFAAEVVYQRYHRTRGLQASRVGLGRR